MITALVFLLLGSEGPGLTIGKGIFRDGHVKLMSREVALIGLGGPIDNPKSPERDFSTTYSVLLIRFKGNYDSYEIVSKLELSNLDKEKTNGGNQSIFDLSSDCKFLYVKPEVSAYLHVIEVSSNKLKLASRFDHAGEGELGHLQSIVSSRISNKIVLSFFNINHLKAECVNTILICANVNGKLVSIAKNIFSDMDTIIFKGCLLDAKLLALIAPEKIIVINLTTGKVVNIYRFVFQYKNWALGPRFEVNDCWFQQDSENYLQVFVAAPYDELIQIEIKKSTDIEFNKKNTNEVFGNTRFCSYICWDSRSLFLCTEFGADYKIFYYKVRRKKKDRIVFISTSLEQVRSFSTVPGAGVFLINKDQKVSLVPFCLED